MGTRRRWWLPLLAALLGAGAGVATAVVAPDDTDQPDLPGQRQLSASSEDPLHVGAPLADLGCTGEGVLVLGYGDGAVPLRSAVANNADLEVSYLRVDDSCDTLWAPPESEPPDYVAYAGPFESLGDACRTRMTGEHKRDDVTALNAGNETYVKCVCELPRSELERLEPGEGTNPERGIWVRALQNTLVDIDESEERRDGFGDDDVTGIYDERTAERVREIQEARGDIVPGTGVVDERTWKLLTDDICGTYDY